MKTGKKYVKNSVCYSLSLKNSWLNFLTTISHQNLRFWGGMWGFVFFFFLQSRSTILNFVTGKINTQQMNSKAAYPISHQHHYHDTVRGNWVHIKKQALYRPSHLIPFGGIFFFLTNKQVICPQSWLASSRAGFGPNLLDIQIWAFNQHKHK